ncbi:hypothetical protein NDU88_001452 [Pleurodeles waltl]|uniref:Uncharacterized protein n=1 Tax=Pleurodeles waltl TaxID=8319 RepID=A0AAV7MKJ6_PLEWA|nr:hypothetical protein NDU88_001452 [Pleurodeles waltl]
MLTLVALSPKGRTGSGAIVEEGHKSWPWRLRVDILRATAENVRNGAHPLPGKVIVKPALLPSDGIPGSPEEKVQVKGGEERAKTGTVGHNKSH